MGSAEGIPQTEGAVVSLSLRHLLDFKVGGHIAAIHIAHRVGLYQQMVKSCVKDSFLLVGAFHIDATQLFLPHIMGGLHILFKLPAFGFCLHVFAGSVTINGRDGHFHRQLIAFFSFEAEGSTQRATVHHIAVADIQASVHQNMFSYRFREFGAEIDLTQFRPASNDTVTFYGVVIDNSDLCLNHIV